MSFYPAQLQPYALAGGGAVAGATSVTLKSFQTIDGVDLAMADFGSVGYGTLEPGNGTQEEQISFTGVVQNSNGSATLTGVKTVLFLTPYTEASGLAKTHAGSTSFVISNTSGFYDQFPAKDNDETITGQWTFLNTPIVPGTVSDASTTVKGVSKLSVAALSATDPIVVGDNDTRVVPYAASSTGTDAYAITTVPNLLAYAAGQKFTFKADVANTGAATLNVNALGAVPLKKEVSLDLETGDIVAGQLVLVEYDGTNFQMLSTITRRTPIMTVYTATGSYTVPSGATKVRVRQWGAGSGSPGTTDTDSTPEASQQSAHGTPGNYQEVMVSVVAGDILNVTIGAAGTGTSGFSRTGGNAGGDTTVIDNAGSGLLNLVCKGGANAVAYGAAGTISGSKLVANTSLELIGAGNAGGIQPAPNNSSSQTGGTGNPGRVVIESY